MGHPCPAPLTRQSPHAASATASPLRTERGPSRRPIARRLLRQRTTLQPIARRRAGRREDTLATTDAGRRCHGNEDARPERQPGSPAQIQEGEILSSRFLLLLPTFWNVTKDNFILPVIKNNEGWIFHIEDWVWDRCSLYKPEIDSTFGIPLQSTKASLPLEKRSYKAGPYGVWWRLRPAALRSERGSAAGAEPRKTALRGAAAAEGLYCKGCASPQRCGVEKDWLSNSLY